MYKFVLAGVSALFMAAAACAQPNQTMNNTSSNSKILVASFSATGTTARIAERVAAATGGTLYAITPAEPYTAADLNWMDKNSRSTLEMKDKSSRPLFRTRWKTWRNTIRSSSASPSGGTRRPGKRDPYAFYLDDGLCFTASPPEGHVRGASECHI